MGAVVMSESQDHEGARRTDQELVADVRQGNTEAYSELWARHQAAARSFSNSVTTAFEADDLVAEAYTRVLATLRRGRGPIGPFRPYLYVTIRNIAVSWAKQRRERPLDGSDDVVDHRTADMGVLATADATLALSAFRTLPERWQELLWLSEVEGLPTGEIAERLGMSGSAVGMLALRAREGLRQAWIQAHIDPSVEGSEHRWALEHVGQHARGKLRPRARARFDAHLADCAECSRIAADALKTSNQYTPLVLPVAVGVVGLTSLSGAVAGTDQAQAAEVAPASRRHRRLTLIGVGLALVLGGAVVVDALSAANLENAQSESVFPTPPQGSDGSQTGPSQDALAPSYTLPPTPDPTTSAMPSTGPAFPPGAEGGPGVKPSTGPQSQSPYGSPRSYTLKVTSVDTGKGLLEPVLAGTARPGAVVSVRSGNVAVSASADQSGAWIVPPLKLAAGEHSIVVTSEGQSERVVATVTGPEIFIAVESTATTVTVRSAPQTMIAVAVEGSSPELVQTAADGTAALTVAPSVSPRTVSATVVADGDRSGPRTQIQAPAQ